VDSMRSTGHGGIVLLVRADHPTEKRTERRRRTVLSTLSRPSRRPGSPAPEPVCRPRTRRVGAPEVCGHGRPSHGGGRRHGFDMVSGCSRSAP
jgi:hypothetical protein